MWSKLLIVVRVVICFEVGALFLSISSENFYSHEATISAKFHGQRDSYSRFLVNQYDGLTGWKNGLTGWKNPKSFSRKIVGCNGKSTTYSYDTLGARRGGGGGRKT